MLTRRLLVLFFGITLETGVLCYYFIFVYKHGASGIMSDFSLSPWPGNDSHRGMLQVTSTVTPGQFKSDLSHELEMP